MSSLSVCVCVCRLQGEKKVCSLIRRVQAYLEPRLLDSHPNVLCQIYIRRIEHLYYKVRCIMFVDLMFSYFVFWFVDLMFSNFLVDAQRHHKLFC